MYVESEDSGDAVPDGALLAALDIGSNSFHLIVARVEHGEIRPVETLSEKVQLAAGMRDELLAPDAMERGIACLARFRQLLDRVKPYRVRAVGTNALRIAHNRRQFLHRAGLALGFSVDVIYGREEARLIYLGVAHTLADDRQARLVVDIGGGSTEFIIGQRFEPQRLESLQMGSVAYTNRFFADGKISAKRYFKAQQTARLEVSHIRHQFHCTHWQDCVGSSGTLQAIETLLSLNGWSTNGINREGLSKLETALLRFNRMDQISLEGLSEQRRNVILAGVAIATAIFDELEIPHMRCSRGALREGVIYDLLGRLSHEDVRERTVKALAQRYNVDSDMAQITVRRAHFLYLATRESWQLARKDRELLRWSAQCHELGMAISHKHYNRHGAYLLRHADLPGFSQQEQETIAVLILCHRRKFGLNELRSVPEEDRERVLRLIVLLRLATLFKYVEVLETLPDFQVVATAHGLSLCFPPSWLAAHPLTVQALAQEQKSLRALHFELQVTDRTDNQDIAS